jgi:hypothetical protein
MLGLEKCLVVESVRERNLLRLVSAMHLLVLHGLPKTGELVVLNAVMGIKVEMLFVKTSMEPLPMISRARIRCQQIFNPVMLDPVRSGRPMSGVIAVLRVVVFRLAR